ncbi:hypothetical protein SPF06_13815 [Sinomonas sp. JGH33]|uniref:Uncharacterized protein n=1 Tax=Sinomonas terricola TaxID=3110330 RepID=A0ABU5T801_9MICC|nr:hypothetical protein [Sinomonas sp. JGH33]MEA5455807.1 hypothetical protein [Sinomonas sp. JGH33]
MTDQPQPNAQQGQPEAHQAQPAQPVPAQTTPQAHPAQPEAHPAQPPQEHPSQPEASAPTPGPPPALDLKTLLPAAAVGAIAFVGTYVVALAMVALAIAGLAMGQGSFVAPANSAIPQGLIPDPAQIPFQVAAQWVAMSQFGTLGATLEATVPFMGSIHGSVSTFGVPLLFTAISAALCFAGGRFTARKTPRASTLSQWVGALASGAVFCVLANAVAAGLAIPLSAPNLKVDPATAFSVGSVFGSFIVATLAFAAGRGSLLPRTNRWDVVHSWLRPVAAVGVHYALFLVIAIPAAIIVVGVRFGWSATLSASLWAPTAGLDLVGLGHLSPLSRSWSSRVMFSSSSNTSGSDLSLGMNLAEFGIPAWAGWLLVLLAIAAALCTSVFWHLRRGPIATNGTRGWAPLPAAYLAAGLVTAWLSIATVSVDLSNIASVHGNVMLTPLTGLALLAWGLVVEASSRYVAPHLAPYVPLPLARRIVANGQGQSAAIEAVGSPGDAASPDTAGTPGAGALVNGGQQATSASASAPAATLPHPALAPRKPLSPRAKRTLVVTVGAGAVLAVLAIGAAITLSVLKGSNGPDKPVTGYLQALVDGQASKALSLSDPNVANEQRVLLDDAVYSKAARRIDGFSIISTKVNGDSATVVAEVRQSGRKQESTFSLRKDNPNLLGDNWKLTSALLGKLTISADVQLHKATVNGQDIPVSFASNGYSLKGPQLPVLPGEYTIELPASEKYLTAQKVVVLVSIDDYTGMARLDVEPSEALITEAAAQADAHLAECLKSTEARPQDCPFGIYATSSTIRNLRWALVKKPSYRLAQDYAASGTSGWTLRTDDRGEAKADFERDRSYGFGTPEWKSDSSSSSVSFSAKVSVQNGSVRLEYSRY